MTTSKKRVLCVFCNTVRERAREDIIPQWVSDELGGVPPIVTEHISQSSSGERRQFTSTDGSMATLRFPNVCKPCNTTWMSMLEKMTAPIVRGALHGEEVTLVLRQQRQVAAWVQLKGLCIDAYYDTQYGLRRHLPDYACQNFAQHIQPVANAKVWLGAFEGVPNGVLVPFSRRSADIPEPGKEQAMVRTVRATITFGKLALRSEFAMTDEPQVSLPPPSLPDSRYWIQIWPVVESTISWPPRLTIPLREGWRLHRDSQPSFDEWDG